MIRNKRLNKFLVFCILMVLPGCSFLTEAAKSVWGSSTKSLERARIDAVTKTYECNFNECFDAALSLARNAAVDEPVTKKFFDVFINNRVKGHIVVMGIEGNVDTTEVGIFFVEYGHKAVRIEISSLSSSAKEKVAAAVFKELELRFTEKREVNQSY